jgi:hypothetical protein
MPEKKLLSVFLWLNVALAGCFVSYVLISSSSRPKVAAVSFAPLAGMTSSVAAVVQTGAVATAGATNVSPATSAATNPVPEEISGVGTNGADAALVSSGNTNEMSQPMATGRIIGWEQLDKPEYDRYLASLKAVGCPPEKVRYIVLSDINDLIGKRRVKEAVAHDIQWWRSEPELALTGALQEKGRGLDEERNRLISKYLGSPAVEEERGEAMLWSNVQLTGPVLGGLAPEVHNTVQEICGRSLERSQASFWARVNDGQPPNQVDMAKMREQTRADLRKILKPDAMEEFLLRYSLNAHQLRLNLRGFEPTPDEFRKIFRATDALDHQLQLEYGGAEALSQEQKERYERQRDVAIREALGPRRYQDYLMTKDPLYRQAQMTALQYGAPPKAILPIYQMTKDTEARRQQILNDATLTPQQKSQALNSVQQDQIRAVQKIVTDAASQPR